MQAWVDAGRLAPVNPQHLLFMLWATTQHCADFSVQVEALTGQTLANPGVLRADGRECAGSGVEGVGPR